jgi:hypothetical protein
MGCEPQQACRGLGIDARRRPPSRLVAASMDLTMMAATKGNSEFVTDLAAKRSWLRKTQMMRVGGRAAADQAGLLHDEAKVLAVAQAGVAR